MTLLRLDPRYHAPLFTALSRRFPLLRCEMLRRDMLELPDIPRPALCYALSTGVFPIWEYRRLQRLAGKELRAFSPEEKQAALDRGWELAQTGPDPALWYTGPRRYEKLAARLNALPADRPLDAEGFWRFALPGHDIWLRQQLLRGADDVLAAGEEQAFTKIIRQMAAPVKSGPELHLFFEENGCFHLWQRDGAGIRQAEGGRLKDAEAMLLGELIRRRPQKLCLHEPELASESFCAWLQRIFPRALAEGTEQGGKKAEPPLDKKKMR